MSLVRSQRQTRRTLGTRRSALGQPVIATPGERLPSGDEGHRSRGPTLVGAARERRSLRTS